MSVFIDPKRYLDAHVARLGALRGDQRTAISAILAFMADDAPLTDLRHAAYMLATAWHETAKTMRPIAEIGPVAYFNRYDPVLADTDARRETARRNGNTLRGDGYRFRGRGYVQLTWQVNYRKASSLVGADLVADPDRAMDPAIAYRIMSHGMRNGWFTGKRLSDYIVGPRCDYMNARRIINAMDKAALIAGYARHFEAALKASIGIAAPLAPTTAEVAKPEDPADKPGGFWSGRNSIAG
jgi:putative chitinase